MLGTVPPHDRQGLVAAGRRLAALLCLGLACLAPVTRAGAAEAFVPGTEDVPLMPGLSAGEDAAILFDRPDGRIVEAVADGTASAAAVSRFYAETLPQLGWTPDGDGIWRREKERLELRVAGAGGRTKVRFLLSPLESLQR